MVGPPEQLGQTETAASPQLRQSVLTETKTDDKFHHSVKLKLNVVPGSCSQTTEV